MEVYNKPFFCYSKKLKEELDVQGIRYSNIGTNKNSGRPYWLYLPSDELSQYLEQRRAKFK